MRLALLITDLEGVAGADTLEALVAGSVAHSDACARLTREVRAAIQGLLEGGFDRVRVSDSHRAGLDEPNVRAGDLPPQAELLFEDDAYSERVFEGVEAVACLGMHAPAGGPGFAAHTVEAHCGWYAGRRALGEPDIVFGLAAERGLPVIFASGDDVLGARLGDRVRYVTTKRARSLREAESRPGEEVERLLREAARQAPSPAPPAPKGALRLRFKSRWQAELAEAAGGEREGELTVLARGETFRERYARGLELLSATGAPLGRALRGYVGHPSFCEDAATLLARPLRRARPLRLGEAAERALAAFLRRTEGEATWQRALRALTLHMLEGHAPAFFRAQGLAPAAAEAVASLRELPGDFPSSLDPEEAMARLDGLYVRSERGEPLTLPLEELSGCIQAVSAVSDIHAWLLAELAAQLGAPGLFTAPPRLLRDVSRLVDLYWLTHLFLLETRYLRRPLPPWALQAETEELLLAAGWAVAERRVDLSAELAMCLQVAGEHRSVEHGELLRAVLRHQERDGSVLEPPRPGEPAEDRSDAHCTAAALLALAGADRGT